MNSVDSKQPVEIFQQVQVILNNEFKKFYEEEAWLYVLKKISKETGLNLKSKGESHCFHGSWKNIEEAYQILKDGVLSGTVNDFKTISDEENELKSDSSSLTQSLINSRQVMEGINLQKTSAKPGFFSVDYINVNITVTKGNILQEDVQAILCPISYDFSIYGFLHYIFQKINIHDLRNYLKNSLDYKVLSVNNLIIIVILLPKPSMDDMINMKILINLYEKVFKICGDLKLLSLAIPLVYQDDIGIPLNVNASAAWKSLELFSHYRERMLKYIRFVGDNNDSVHVCEVVFQSSIKKFKNTTQNSNNADKSSGAISKQSSKILYKKERERELLKNECPICLSDIDGDELCELECKHKFCKPCLTESFKHRKECPVCRKHYDQRLGNQPPGSMTHHVIKTGLPGYEKYDTIAIDYHFGSGIQTNEHPNPGKSYCGTSRKAYLPDSSEGREVFDLLCRAFDQKLTFTIGKSATTGIDDSIVWNDIHHKTSMYGGDTNYGYPDPTYLKRVKMELAEMGIK